MVPVFHSGAAYSSAVNSWPYHEKASSGLIGIFMLFGDVFMMSILIFIAGYFALPSVKKRGIARFLANKLKVLMLPWLVITVIVVPILDYINFSFQNSETVNFISYWGSV
jgi:hypothetical protein